VRICALAPDIGPALAAMGHEVVTLWPEEGGVFDLPEALAERGFAPELIFQRESLGPRTLVKGLQDFDCPKIFWSIDTHLNLFWQRHYLALFDAVMTPHVSILQGEPGIPPVGRLAPYGYARPWLPFAERPMDVCFVGRFTEHRPMRRWLAEFLSRHYAARIEQDIPKPAMLELYAQSRLAPNEAILAEVNFRLIEAASCGCLVLSQDVGPDQDVLLAPGREIEVFSHVLELKSLLDYYLERPDEAERQARAAWERVQDRHLVQHRAQAVLDFAAKLPRSAAEGEPSRAAYWLTLFHLQRCGMLQMPRAKLEQALANLEQSPAVLAARVTLLAEADNAEVVVETAAGLLAQERYEDDLMVNQTVSAAGLRLGDWSLAKQFWYRQARSRGLFRPTVPQDAAHLCRLWAAELARAGRVTTPGFGFGAERHLPTAATEWMHLALTLRPGDLELLRQLNALQARVKGYEYLRLGALSTLSLHDRANWRIGAVLGMTDLKAFRLEQGLEELLVARAAARGQGKERSFQRFLAGMDPRGTVPATLEKLGQTE
jgi:hypothetical protein